MKGIEQNNDFQILEIDFSKLMDLRIDFAFKLLFTKGNPRLLISLLNAIFANKKIPRVIKSITIKNPFMEKESSGDKLSILDIRAALADGTDILIEMHMYGLGELKAKTIRSWARAYGEELDAGNSYADQPPTIVIAFANGRVESINDLTHIKSGDDKIHRLCMIMDCDDHTVFTDSMELHYIDMKAFAKTINESGCINIYDTEGILFAKWLSIITQKEINNKNIIEDACRDEEEIRMAVSALARQSEDKIVRQAYQRRQDEIYFYNKNIMEYKLREEELRRRAEESQRIAEEARRGEKEARCRAEIAESELGKKDALIAQLKARLGEK